MPGLVILWFASLAVIISMAYSKQVATQQYALLALVGAAAERSMPLETAFAAFGHERGGWMRRRTAEIVYMLNHGASLPAALKAVPGALPPEAVPLVCVGHENGSLGPAIAQAIAARNLFEPVWQSIVPKIGYICILPAVAVGIVAFIVMKIMPQFEKIFKDFDTRLPDITLAVFAVCRWEFLWLLLGAALAVHGGAVRLRPCCATRARSAGTCRAWIWLLRRRHMATVLDALALAAQRQRPLGEALSTLAVSYPQRPIAAPPVGRLRRIAGRRRRLAMPASPRFAGRDGLGPACNRRGETATSPGPRGKWPTATAAASSTASIPCCKWSSRWSSSAMGCWWRGSRPLCSSPWSISF